MQIWLLHSSKNICSPCSAKKCRGVDAALGPVLRALFTNLMKRSIILLIFLTYCSTNKAITSVVNTDPFPVEKYER